MQVFSAFKVTLKSMKLIQYLHIVLPYHCWRDFFYESPASPPDRRLWASQQWEREHSFYHRRSNNYGWAELEHHLGWLKELRGSIEVAVTSFERADLLPKTVPSFRRLEAGHFVLVE